jgi:hypothetical protein
VIGQGRAGASVVATESEYARSPQKTSHREGWGPPVALTQTEGTVNIPNRS